MIEVELVFSPNGERVHRTTLRVEKGTSLERAVAQSSWIGDVLPEDWSQYQVGIWGECVERSHPLTSGDRIEIYVPVLIDPKQARRIRAQKK